MIAELFGLLVFFAPAYAANMTAVWWGKGSRPLDGGWLVAGRPLFGRNKTVGGLVGGTLSGALLGMLFQLPFQRWSVDPSLAVAIAFGALAGDLVGSFLKRRFDLPPGHGVPVLDQLDYIAGGAAGGMLIAGSVPVAFDVRAPTWLVFLTLMFGASYVVNHVAFRLRLKAVPY